MTKFIKKNKLIFISTIFIFIELINGGLSYIYQILLSRLLQPKDFGSFQTILAFSIILITPISSYAMLVSRKFSYLKGLGLPERYSYQYNQFERKIIFFLLGFSLLFLMSCNIISEVLKIKDVRTVYLILFFIISTSIFTLTQSVLQGLQKFKLLGSLLLFTSLTKIITSYFFLEISKTVNALLIANIITMLLFAIFFIISIRKLILNKKFKKTQEKFSISNDLSITSTVRVIFYSLIFTASCQLDIIYINLFFTSEEIANFAVAGIFSKSTLYILGGTTSVLFPISSESYVQNSSSNLIYKKIILLASIIFFVLLVFFWFFGNEFIEFIYNKKYIKSGYYVKYYLIAFFPIVIIGMLENLFISRDKLYFSYILFFTLCAQYFLIYFFHNSIIDVIFILGTTNYVALLFGLRNEIFKLLQAWLK